VKKLGCGEANGGTNQKVVTANGLCAADRRHY